MLFSLISPWSAEEVVFNCVVITPSKSGGRVFLKWMDFLEEGRCSKRFALSSWKNCSDGSASLSPVVNDLLPA